MTQHNLIHRETGTMSYHRSHRSFFRGYWRLLTLFYSTLLTLTDRQTDRETNTLALRAGGTFFSVVLLCQFFINIYLVYNTVVIFLLLFPPYLSCLQNNPPENNVEPVPAKSEPVQLWLCRFFCCGSCQI